MRKLVVYTLTSLDGAVEDPRRYFQPVDANVPGPPSFDPDMDRLERALIDTQDAVVLGRRTYDEWSRYWPTSDEQPFADFINGVRKYVVTSTPLEREWPGTEVVDGPPTDFVARLKQGAVGDIGVHGSITLARSLIAAGLVDELQLAVGPVLDAEGPRLFEGLTGWQRLELVDATSTSGGTVWLTYRPATG
ncbi:dihydrofolate reductase family protein [Luteipulveratus halotolerans]|uniref:Bacterial bifunctional deaminase-reductase C-terminal domain-containing protein n=1 Tax=Luteipulveratus halotolerans TaxID=1631356 RepID=A0A0L6CLD7_9MICO|nr:dihydrofolate reductase family protein [Luteipulveratus halotolerans]KNX38529.1 hypothetical protein VV01_17450 [Luteipulveratus halotolerans]